jgi:hypothetical protein
MGCHNELRQSKLERVRPPSVGHAERIEGMTPAAIALLLAIFAVWTQLGSSGKSEEPLADGRKIDAEGCFPDSAFVSRETRERLEAYADLVRKWQSRINLISPKTLPDLWSRHILDSLQLFAVEASTGHAGWTWAVVPDFRAWSLQFV